MKTFTHHNQPYGTVVFSVESVTPVAEIMAGRERDKYGSSDFLFRRAEKGWVELTGTVIKGGVTSRLFHATSTRDLAGEKYSLQVPPADYERGSYTTVAM